MNDWHIEDIKAELRKRGTSFSEIARAEKVNKSLLTNVAKGVRSERIEKAIADALDKKPAEIWPSRLPKKAVPQ